MTALGDLPPELLTHLFSFLPGGDLAKVCRVCRKFRDVLAVDHVWQRRCEGEFGIPKIIGLKTSYFRFYSKVLYKYGRLLGLWKANMPPYGGLFQVMIKGQQLVGIQWLPPVDPYVYKELRRRLLFSVQIGDQGNTEVHCHKGFSSDPHECHLEWQTDQFHHCDRFYYKCSKRDRHRHPGGKAEEFAVWLSEETSRSPDDFMFIDSEPITMRFIATIQYEKGFELERLEVQRPLQSALIQPGLFKGQYGAHGIEILKLSYNQDLSQAVVYKVSGDPNVPASETSIDIDVSRPMVLNREQQQSLSVLKQIDIQDLPPQVDLDKLPTQPFIVPQGCHERNQKIPETCKARFHSQGHIAGHGYTNPSTTPGHLVVFDENTFGHLWIGLASFSLFSRITEDLDKVLDNDLDD